MEKKKMSDKVNPVANCENGGKMYKKFNYREKKSIFQQKVVEKIKMEPELWDTTLGKIHSRSSRSIYASIAKAINQELSTCYNCN